MLHEAEFWVAVAFVLMLGIFGYFGANRVIFEALDKRSARIRKDLDDARRLKEEAQSLVAEYRARRQTAEREAQEIVAAPQAEAERIAVEAKAKMEDFVACRTMSAESLSAQAETLAVADVRAAAAVAAASAAASVLSQTVKGDVANGLIEKSIKDLGSKLN